MILDVTLSQSQFLQYLNYTAVLTGVSNQDFIEIHCNPRGLNDLILRTIFHWPTPVSPHIAVTLAGNTPPSDTELLRRVRQEAKYFHADEGPGSVSTNINTSLTPNQLAIPSSETAHNSSPASPAVSHTSPSKRHFMLLETAGGALSPGPSRTLQADVYRPLRLPVVLVGDSKLGGSAHTINLGV